MFTSHNRINKPIFYLFTILVLISVILIWGFSLPNVLSADDKVKDKVEEKEDKKDKKEKKEEKEEEKDKEDKDKDKEDKDKGSKTFHITASCNHGGSISPKGSQDITKGGSIAFSCTAYEDYSLIYLRVDNEKIEGITSYTFTDIDSNHTIHAMFKKIKAPKDDQGDEDDQATKDDQGDEDDQATKDDRGDEDSDNNFLDDYNGNMIVFCSSFFIFNNSNSLKIKEKNSNNIKTKKIEKSYDKKYLFDIIEINDTDQLLDIKAITKKNKITEILDVDDIINEGNYIEIGQLDLNTDNPFISAFIFVWGKMKDFSYYYNS